jgi:hypothetical protein
MLQQLAEIILLAAMRHPLSLRNVEDENLPIGPVDASAIPRKKRRLTRIIGQRILMEETLRERELERSEKCLSEAAPRRDRLMSAIRSRLSKPASPLPAILRIRPWQVRAPDRRSGESRFNSEAVVLATAGWTDVGGERYFRRWVLRRVTRRAISLIGRQSAPHVCLNVIFRDTVAPGV